MSLQFTKMHGAGNDFVMLNGVTQSIDLSAAHYRALADRHFGIGADQILLVESPQASDADDIDFRYRIFNADGNEVEHCGNGARCFVRFVRDQGLTSKRRLKVKTVNGIVEPELLESGLVRVNMDAPRFELSEVPFLADGLQAVPSGAGQFWPLELNGTVRSVAVASMGNPHAVQIVDDVDTAPVLTEGPLTVGHARFPNGVNAGFMQVVSRTEVRLRVFERGAGETLACGTGACAAMALGVQLGLLDPVVRLQARGGELLLEWQGGAQDPIWMSGNAVPVFESTIDPDQLL
ncbi:MAG: diaminopimelate epimerase [Burkholderiaceae bacterium]